MAPIESVDIPLAAATADRNQRAVHRIVVRTAAGAGGPALLNVFATHLSTDAAEQLSNADWLVAHIASLGVAARPRVIVGDLNAYHDNGLVERFAGFAAVGAGCTYRCGSPGEASERDLLLLPTDSFSTAYNASCAALGTAMVESDHRGLSCAVTLEDLPPAEGNFDFEAAPLARGVAVGPADQLLAPWLSSSAALVRSGGIAGERWPSSGDGRFYVALRGATASVQRDLGGLSPGAGYALAFLASGGSGARLDVRVDGVVVWRSAGKLQPDTFASYTCYFAVGASTATLRFMNDGRDAGAGDVLVDAVSLEPAADDAAVPVKNAGFEGTLVATAGGVPCDYAEGTPRFSLADTAVPNWLGRAAIVANGCAEYGGLSSGYGHYFLGLLRAGAKVAQVVRVKPSQEYEVSFVAAFRVAHVSTAPPPRRVARTRRAAGCGGNLYR